MVLLPYGECRQGLQNTPLGELQSSPRVCSYIALPQLMITSGAKDGIFFIAVLAMNWFRVGKIEFSHKSSHPWIVSLTRLRRYKTG